MPATPARNLTQRHCTSFTASIEAMERKRQNEFETYYLTLRHLPVGT